MEAAEAVAGGTHEFSMPDARAAEAVYGSSCRELTSLTIKGQRALNTSTGGVFVKAWDAGTRTLAVGGLNSMIVLLARSAGAECIVGRATIIDTHKVIT